MAAGIDGYVILYNLANTDMVTLYTFAAQNNLTVVPGMTQSTPSEPQVTIRYQTASACQLLTNLLKTLPVPQ